MTIIQTIKKIITNRNKAYTQLDAQKASEYTNQLAIWLPKLKNEEDKSLVLQWLSEKNEQHYNLILNAFREYKNKMQHTKIYIYDQEYDLSQRCTITQYAKIMNIKSTQVITNQIKRGKISAQNILIVPELDLKLVRLP